MDLLTAVLVMCIQHKDLSSDCDIRVHKHVVGRTIEKCGKETIDTGERVKQSLLANPEEMKNIKDIRISAKCYTDAYGSQVISLIPAWMENSNSSYTISYY